MIGALALSAALLATPQVHHFQTAFFSAGNYAEATINVDPTAGGLLEGEVR